jgi:hypothetical protein
VPPCRGDDAARVEEPLDAGQEVQLIAVLASEGLASAAPIRCSPVPPRAKASTTRPEGHNRDPSLVGELQFR